MQPVQLLRLSLRLVYLSWLLPLCLSAQGEELEDDLEFDENNAEHTGFEPEDLSPMDVAKVYFSPMPPQVKQLVTCCELDSEDALFHDQMMFMLPDNRDAEAELLWSRGDSAVARTYLKVGEFERAYYIFMVKREGWKVAASRTVQGIDLAESLLLETRELDDIGVSQLDSSLANASNGQMTWRLMLRNAWLLTSSDDDLQDYFFDNREAFSTLRQRTYESLAIMAESRDRVVEFNPMLAEALKTLALQDASIDRYLDEKHDKVLFFQIGGNGYDTMGYFYAEKGARIPRMWHDRFILVQPLEDGWYLFKTS
ncbi:MAG: hypothetical protein ACOCZ8_00305 [Bacteroidota bacterium]